MRQFDRKELREILHTRFDKWELRELLLELNINPNELADETGDVLAMELVRRLRPHLFE
jgi:hypothetical protein